MKNHKILQYYHTLKYLKPKQIVGRVWGEQKRKYGLYSLSDFPDSLSGGLFPKTKFIYHEPGNNPGKVERGVFQFLNREVDLGQQIEWKPNDESLLWRFNLHYFNYLPLLTPDKQKKVSLDWIRENQNDHSVGMHPYPTSLRIVNWCKSGIQHEAIEKSLYQQTAFLSRNTEFFHPGNHYLENARALIFAGIYFNGVGESAHWLAQGFDIYRRELPVQVLPDGGYFERSIMYHALVLAGILDIINISSQESEISEFFHPYAQKMADFLFSLTHPDGTLSLYNDTTVEITPSTESILNYAHSVAGITPGFQTTFSDTGYYVYKDENIYLTIDGGSIGPDYLPAHSHADIFSYQVSLRDRQFIVDSGVFGYESNEMRDYVRSTRAHNTVCVDKRDQAEMWCSFRVARRFKPYDVQYHQNDKTTKFSGKFGGYAKLIGDGIIHTRKITIKDERVSIEDEITGSGEHLVESLIHLHPKVSLQRTSNGVLLQRDDILCNLEYNGIGFGIERGWYCPEFGKKIPNKVLVFHNNGSALPIRIKYSLKLL